MRWETFDFKKKWKTPTKNSWNSGPTPVARGGSGVEAPPLAARKSEIEQVVWSQIFEWETSDLAKNGLIGVHRPRKCQNEPCAISETKLEPLSDFNKQGEKSSKVGHQNRNWLWCPNSNAVRKTLSDLRKNPYSHSTRVHTDSNPRQTRPESVNRPVRGVWSVMFPFLGGIYIWIYV